MGSDPSEQIESHLNEPELAKTVQEGDADHSTQTTSETHKKQCEDSVKGTIDEIPAGEQDTSSSDKSAGQLNVDQSEDINKNNENTGGEEIKKVEQEESGNKDLPSTTEDNHSLVSLPFT